MYNHEKLPSEWFSSHKRPRSYHFMPPMSKPVSKNFNRISDFIFPDTVHVRLYQQQQQQQQQYPAYRQYQRSANFSLPVLNRNSFNQHDLIVVERLPVDELNNVDFLYREQHQKQPYQQRYQSNRQIRRRYSSIVDDRRVPSDQTTTNTLISRPAAYRERMRERRKRHTTDNAYHSLMKSMLDDDINNQGEPNYVLSYTTTLDPITDSESIASINQQQHTNNTSSQEWQHETHGRVPVNGTVPVMIERERPRQRQRSSSTSSRDSSTDTDITERHPSTMNQIRYQQNSSVRKTCFFLFKLNIDIIYVCILCLVYQFIKRSSGCFYPSSSCLGTSRI